MWTRLIIWYLFITYHSVHSNYVAYFLVGLKTENIKPKGTLDFLSSKTKQSRSYEVDIISSFKDEKVDTQRIYGSHPKIYENFIRL